jgi:hypothetical protein
MLNILIYRKFEFVKLLRTTVGNAAISQDSVERVAFSV